MSAHHVILYTVFSACFFFSVLSLSVLKQCFVLARPLSTRLLQSSLCLWWFTSLPQLSLSLSLCVLSASRLPPAAPPDRLPAHCLLCPPISLSQTRPAWFKEPAVVALDASVSDRHVALSRRWNIGGGGGAACDTWSQREARINRFTEVNRDDTAGEASTPSHYI